MGVAFPPGAMKCSGTIGSGYGLYNIVNVLSATNGKFYMCSATNKKRWLKCPQNIWQSLQLG